MLSEFRRPHRLDAILTVRQGIGPGRPSTVLAVKKSLVEQALLVMRLFRIMLNRADLARAGRRRKQTKRRKMRRFDHRSPCRRART